MTPAARRRVLVVVPALALPLLLAGGVGAFVVAGGVERRLAWEWSQRLPGSLTLERVALAGPDRVRIEDARVVLDGRTLVRAARVDLDRGNGGIDLTAPIWDAAPAALPAWRRVIAAAASLPPRSGDAALTVRDGRCRLGPIDATALEAALRVRDGRVRGEVAGQIDGTPARVRLAGNLAGATVTLVEPVPIGMAEVRTVLTAYGAWSQEMAAWWSLLPASTVLESATLAPGDVRAVLRWDAAPARWPFAGVRATWSGDRGTVQLAWRAGGPDLTVAIERAPTGDVWTLRCTDGAVPLRALATGAHPGPTWLAAALGDLLPRSVAPGGTTGRWDGDRVQVDLAARWETGEATGTLTYDPAAERVTGTALDVADAGVGHLTGATFRVDAASGEAEWARFDAPALLDGARTTALAPLPWQRLDTALPRGTARWRSAEPWTLAVSRADDAGASLRWHCSGDGGAGIDIAGIAVDILRGRLLPREVDEGRIATARFRRTGGRWRGRATLGEARIALGPWRLTAATASLSVPGDTATVATAEDDAWQVRWEADAVALTVTLAHGRIVAPKWPAGWRGRIRARGPRAAPLSAWSLTLAHPGIDGLLAPWTAEVRDADGTPWLAARSLAWRAPVLAAILPEAGRVTIDATGSRVAGDGWQVRTDADGIRALVQLDATGIAALARRRDWPAIPVVEAAQVLLVLTPDGEVDACALVRTGVALDATTGIDAIPPEARIAIPSPQGVDAAGTPDQDPATEEEPR